MAERNNTGKEGESEARAYLEKLGYIPWWRACKLSAYKGWLKHSDSEKFAKKYHVNEIFRKAAQSVSLHGRKEHIRNERTLLIEACRG